MRVAIPHRLGKEEVRHRLKSRIHELADHLPGGMAEVTTTWPSEDRMTMRVSAMGQQIDGHVDIEDSQVVFEVVLPAALSFVEPIVEGAIRKGGQKLLAPPN
jgi:hypothetical protein